MCLLRATYCRPAYTAVALSRQAELREEIGPLLASRGGGGGGGALATAAAADTAGLAAWLAKRLSAVPLTALPVGLQFDAAAKAFPRLSTLGRKWEIERARQSNLKRPPLQPSETKTAAAPVPGEGLGPAGVGDAGGGGAARFRRVPRAVAVLEPDGATGRFRLLVGAAAVQCIDRSTSRALLVLRDPFRALGSTHTAVSTMRPPRRTGRVQ